MLMHSNLNKFLNRFIIQKLLILKSQANQALLQNMISITILSQG